MNISRVVTLLLALAVAVFVLGNINPASAAKKGVDCEVEDHPSCKNDGGGGDPTTEPPLEDCVNDPCIASVGKWHGRVASEYVMDGGTHTEITSNGFGKILAVLQGPGGDFQALCDAHDVLIFEWDSPNIKNLDWDSLVNYFACGGDVIWEDTTNIVKLTAGVAIDDITNHDKTAPTFFDIMFDSDCIDDASNILCDIQLGINPFVIVNNHIVFSVAQPALAIPALKLLPFLIQLSNGKVLGLYGVFDNVNGGCIVMTGPDNNFHGNLDFSGPNEAGPHNQHALLTHELNWLLESPECNP